MGSAKVSAIPKNSPVTHRYEPSGDAAIADKQPPTVQRLKDLPLDGETAIANALSQQLIYQMNLLQPKILVSIEDLNVSLEPAAYPLIQPRAKAALARAIQARGKTLLLTSGYRTIAQQQILYNGRQNNPNPVALPGTSNHQSGLAIDIDDTEGWLPYLEAEGWKWLGHDDPPHFDYIDPACKHLGPLAILAFQTLWNQNNPQQKLGEDGHYGASTEQFLNQSPVQGFAIAPWHNNPRLLRLQTPRMAGADVAQLQQQLSLMGFFSAKADAVFGPQTEQAVRAFQAAKALVADGIVGQLTRQHLNQGSAVAETYGSSVNSPASDSAPPGDAVDDSADNAGDYAGDDSAADFIAVVSRGPAPEAMPPAPGIQALGDRPLPLPRGIASGRSIWTELEPTLPAKP